MAIWINLSLVLLMAFLLGYTPHGRACRVFNLETNTVVESCDVTFDELLIVCVMSLSVQETRKCREHLCR
jgi:hypothetical protein